MKGKNGNSEVVLSYVGIRNWPEKGALLKSQNYEIGEVETGALTFDCERHLAFLRTFSELGNAFDSTRTLYYAFYRFLKGEGAAAAKSKRFQMMFQEFRGKGPELEKFVISVTADGARLDGSHRGSIATVLGISKLPARIFRWIREDKVKHIREEMRLKREMHHAHMGFCAYSKKSREYLGSVIYTDIVPVEKRFLTRRTYEFRPVVALQKDGFYRYVDQERVLLLER